MKVPFFLLALTIGTANAAHLVCPGRTNEVMRCTKANQPGDYDVASLVMDGAIVCKDQRGHLSLALSTTEGQSPMYDVTEVVRMGATTYSWKDDGVSFALTKSINGKAINGKFSLWLRGSELYRSLKCK